ncbi:hypothetical protein [Methylophaga sp. OBS4]|uniref:hypothetical protein n=1 Tax=Methylophaga sp. OBS4 TaxID=2991935 RepID=UPI00224C956B|nr:hypothetical protein [Methylophaga sp. OBS4]MCX4186779.1 hypothetical protein [Methylophaga sp. OBS4]
MSTEFADNIRRIARGTRRKGALGEYQERDPVLGGTVTLVTNAYALGGGTGGSGETPTSNAPNSETQQQEQGNDQQAPNPDDPNTFYRGGSGTVGNPDSATQQGNYDIEDIIDKTDGPQAAPNPDGSLPDGYDSSIRSMNGATDCSTGQCINFHTDGNFPAPEGWEDADTPPDAEGYENFDPDYYWSSTFTSANGSVIVVEEAAVPVLYDSFIAALTAMPEIDGFSVFSPLTKISDVRWRFQWSAFDEGVGTGVITQNLDRSSCSAVGVPSDACIAAVPKASEWPEDGCYDLALIDGQFTTNQYDSEAPAGAGGSKVDFCFGDGRTGSVEVTANGGTMIYETVGGVPTGRATVYGQDGTYQGAGDATETFMDQHRPK